jgi:DNA-binding NarL/FixJ family response regulator
VPRNVRDDRRVAIAAPCGLVGRARERAAIDGVLAGLEAGAGAVVVIEGEPGIGKSRVLAHVAASAAQRGATVLEARAAEFESDLPYAIFTEALDRPLAAAGERALRGLGLADAAALVGMLPALRQVGAEPAAPDRHGVHRAVRDLLERLASSRPLVLCLDDVQWADPASVEALAALVRRPPAAPVLLVLAARVGARSAPLTAALAGARRDDRLLALTLGPLDASEAAELVGPVAAEIYAHAGGNPFFLEQLARGRAARGDGAAGEPSAVVPAAVAVALSSELAALEPAVRRLVEGAAVVGDPFELTLAGEVAQLDEPAALRALDTLLATGLVRATPVPRRFAFRHPLVRDAVFGGVPGGWRLGAHARAATALERRGAGAVARARHVEHAAVAGDAEAIAVLSAAAHQLQAPAPASAARLFAATLRLLPDGPEHESPRARLSARLADAQAAAGDAAAARRTLDDALRVASSAERLALTVALANQEWWLGGHELARRRLHVALGDVPAEPSADRIRLRLALALTALFAGELTAAEDHASDARDDARAIGDAVFEAAALSAGALASVLRANGPQAGDRLAESTAALERLTVEQLTTRLVALWMHGRARRMLGRFDDALADLERGAALAIETSRERITLMLTVESARTLIELGRVADARRAAQDGVERAELTGNPRVALWAHSTLSAATLAAGDVAGALSHAEHAARAGCDADVLATGQPGWCLGAALTAAGNPQQAVAAMLDAFGGATLARVLPAERPAAAADLVEAQLASRDLTAAEATLTLGAACARRAGSPWAAAITGIAESSVLLARDHPREALAAATRAREAAADAPLARARAQLAEGRALAAAGKRRDAIETLIAAESALHDHGALRRRDEAVRELRRLGHRVVRHVGAAGADSHAALTPREHEIAQLAAAGRTNREIAEQLVLSPRTIEAHLRTIYAKLGIRSRIELTRTLPSTMT